MIDSFAPNKSNREEAERFLKILFGQYFDKYQGNVEIRFVSTGSALQPKFYKHGQISESDWNEIVNLNKTYHVFFGVNPRRGLSGKQPDIKDVICLWVDVDGKDFEGGKVEALKKVVGFPLRPSIVVDSGRGFHCYWLLNEPLINISDEQRLELRQTLAGIIAKIGGDRSRSDLSSCLRLPGTFNIKEENPLECKVLEENPDRYQWDQFKGFRDLLYKEPILSDEPLPAFGTRSKVVSRKNEESALADVEELEISSKTKNLIITGGLLRKKGSDHTRSGRDMSIICGLIYSDYDYATIESIFFNPFLKCSNRIMDEGEAALQRDVRNALAFVRESREEGTSASRRITEIKNMQLTAEEKRKKINAFIVGDLLTNPDAVGEGFADRTMKTHFFFDKAKKMLMNLESNDFYYFMRARYDIPRKDYEEIKDAVDTAIWESKKDVRPHLFAYYDPEQFILYVSDHDNGVYRIDGEKIELRDNGVDRVFFEYDPTLTPFSYDPELKVINYFMTAYPEHKVEGIEFPHTIRRGLSLKQFYQEESLLNTFLIDRVSFNTEQENNISPEEQRLLLIMFFYSLYFESIQKEKPIACFIGQKESGKSFTATSIGKLFFGKFFESTHEPSSADDLKTLLGRHSYLVIDNLDKNVSDEITNVLCVAATGGIVEKRKLYKDTEVVKFIPRCFIVITSREPKFKRDDLVSRLLIFNTRKIDSPISRSSLYEELLENRNVIMTEVLTNLNTIVSMLKVEGREKRKAIRCISRIADWETFGRKICKGPSELLFRMVMQAMNEKKDRFAIEDDYLFIILSYLVYEREEPIEEKTSSELYQCLVATAEEMKLKDFSRRYKSAVSVGKRLAAIKEELGQAFELNYFREKSNKTVYTFRRLNEQTVDL